MSHVNRADGTIIGHPTLAIAVEHDGGDAGYMSGPGTWNGNGPPDNAVVKLHDRLWEIGAPELGGRQMYLREDDGTTPDIWWDADTDYMLLESVDIN